MLVRRSMCLAALAALLTCVGLPAQSPAEPPYRIVLRSRHAEAMPTRFKDAQTGGGAIVVEQPEPNTIVVTMTGAAVAGSDFHASAAAIAFNLDQDLEIVPTRKGLRPPRVGLVGRVVGTLQVTDPKFGKPCGSAEQGTATACLTSCGTSLLSINVKSSSVGCGQELAINHRDGPYEATAAAGLCHLSATFRLAVNQGKGLFNRQAAVADFDPGPDLDAAWADALKPFRALPRREFGFKVIVRVIEEAECEQPAAPVAPPGEAKK